MRGHALFIILALLAGAAYAAAPVSAAPLALWRHDLGAPRVAGVTSDVAAATTSGPRADLVPADLSPATVSLATAACPSVADGRRGRISR